MEPAPPHPIQLYPDELMDVINAIQVSDDLSAAEKRWFVDFIESFGDTFNDLQMQKRASVRRREPAAAYARRAHAANVEWRGELEQRFVESLNPAEREWCRIIKERAQYWLALWDWQ